MIVLRVNSVDLNIGKNIRYIRDTINGSNINSNNEWIEITATDLYNRNVKDTSEGANISASASGPIIDASSVIDGVLTNANPLNVTPGASASVTVDLGQIVKVKSVNILRRYDNNQQFNNTKTEVSLDGANWITLYDSSINGVYTETSSGKEHFLQLDTIAAADWEVSDTRDFSNKIATSYNDTTNINTIVFTNILNIGTNYYGRVRLRLTQNGYTIWSDVNVFIPTDVINHNKLDNQPSGVSIPRLMTGYPTTNHPGSDFVLQAKAFGVESNDILESTSWIIRDINDTILWYSFYDVTNKVTMPITSDMIKLEDNKIYRLSASFNTTGHDSSRFSTMTIHVNNNDMGNLIREDTNSIDATIANTLRILNMEGLTTTSIIIEEVTTLGNTQVYTTSLSSGAISFTIPANTLVTAKHYLITIEPSTSTGSLGKRYTYMKTI